MKPEHKEIMKARKRNIRLTVSYDGTAYNGFQRQNPPQIAVQNVLEEKLQQVCGDTIELAASGRTDAGVHALGQVVNFFTDGRIPVDRLPRAVNSILPPDIVVLEAAEADRDFSARHSAKSKTYIYRILQGYIPALHGQLLFQEAGVHDRSGHRTVLPEMFHKGSHGQEGL